MNAATCIAFAYCVASAAAQSGSIASDTRPVTRPDAVLVFESRAGTQRPYSYRLQVTRDGVVDAGAGMDSRVYGSSFACDDDSTSTESRPARASIQWMLSSVRRARLDELIRTAPGATDLSAVRPPSTAGALAALVIPTASQRTVVYEFGDPAAPPERVRWLLEVERTLGVSKQVLGSVSSWLALHQAPDGFWHTRDFDRDCRDLGDTRCKGLGAVDWDAGVTALNVLNLIGMGYLPSLAQRQNGLEYAAGEGVRALQRLQRADGTCGPETAPEKVVTQAWISLAFSELAVRRPTSSNRDTARRALRALTAMQRSDGAWTLAGGSAADDVTVTAWALLACFSGVAGQLDVEASSLDLGMRVLRRDVSAQLRPGSTDALRVAAARCAVIGRRANLLGGPDPSATNLALLDAAVGTLLREPPSANGAAARIDLNAWVLGSVGAQAIGGDLQSAWESALSSHMHAGTELGGCGSEEPFAPIGPWADRGGRAWSTAMWWLALVHASRYPNAFGASR